MKDKDKEMIVTIKYFKSKEFTVVVFVVVACIKYKLRFDSVELIYFVDIFSRETTFKINLFTSCCLFSIYVLFHVNIV